MTVTKLNALRRLTMRPHAERPAPGKHKRLTIRIIDGEHVVGYVGWADLCEADAEFRRLYVQAATGRPANTAMQTAIKALVAIANFRGGNKEDRSTSMRNLAIDALAEIGDAVDPPETTGEKQAATVL